MDFKTMLAESVKNNDSLACVGLDSDIDWLPSHLSNGPNPILTFNKAIIDATADLVCAYKPNSAFYEAEGPHGIEQLKLTCDYIHERYPNIPIILDAKRGDIGNTNNGYVKFIFDYLGINAVTLHPYLGREAVQPFLDRKERGCIMMCRNSNPGAGEFQDLLIEGEPLYRRVATAVRDNWNDNGNCLLVVGATFPAEMAEVRTLVGDGITFLVPGVGAQGGDIEGTLKGGLTSNRDGLIINSARDIIFASSGEDFADAARTKTRDLRDKINVFR